MDVVKERRDAQTRALYLDVSLLDNACEIIHDNKDTSTNCRARLPYL